jgi:UDP-N-acetylglucosamine--N-acetylmuramyl-(pentapeptide) pyrophosphoryl-undecaprenol N-acetylglucosamine transferase
MAGGTGGHVYPGLAVAEHLRELGVQLAWLGTRAGLESRVVPANSIRLFTIYIGGIRGKKISRRLAAPFMVIIALLQSLWIIQRYRPMAVIGLGGFVSGPGGLAAWLLRIPLYIHEQNSIAGLTNRLLAPLARAVMQGFPGALKGNKVVTTGNPVRKDILLVSQHHDRTSGREQQPLRLLVLGGSLGAQALNEVLPAALRALPPGIRIEVWHQTGREHHAAASVRYQEHGLHASKVVPYIEDMAAAYAWADLVLCRAGALTISELCITGVASVLVPFPHAVDDHQTANARYLSEAGAAILVPQSELSAARLAGLLCEFTENRGKLEDMAKLARSRAYPHATADIARICMGGVNA